MIKKAFCISLIAFGSLLEIYFYVFRFIGDGLLLPVAISAAIALNLLLAFSVYKKIRVLAVAIIIYSTAQTSVGQTFSLLEHTANAGKNDATINLMIAEHRKNLDRLSLEADTINRQLQSVDGIETRSNYGRTVSGATSRLDKIQAERMASLKAISELSETKSQTEQKAIAAMSVYDFYASMPKWSGMDWLKFVFHSCLSILIALMTPIGIATWNEKEDERKAKKTKLERKHIENFVTVAWYKIRKNTGTKILDELSFNDYCLRNNIEVLVGAYAELFARAIALGLISTEGVPLITLDESEIIKRLVG